MEDKPLSWAVLEEMGFEIFPYHTTAHATLEINKLILFPEKEGFRIGFYSKSRIRTLEELKFLLKILNLL